MALRHIKEIYSTLSELQFGFKVMKVRIDDRFFDVATVSGETPQTYLDDRDGVEYTIGPNGTKGTPVGEFSADRNPIFLTPQGKATTSREFNESVQLKKRQLAICVKDFNYEELPLQNPLDDQMFKMTTCIIKNRKVVLLYRDENGNFYSAISTLGDGVALESWVDNQLLILSNSIATKYVGKDTNGNVNISGTLHVNNKSVSVVSGVVTASELKATGADGITADEGSINAPKGTVSGTALTATGDSGITADTGNVTATKGCIIATAGDVTASSGIIEGGTVQTTIVEKDDPATPASSEALRDLGVLVTTVGKGVDQNERFSIQIDPKDNDTFDITLIDSKGTPRVDSGVAVGTELNETTLPNIFGETNVVEISGKLREQIATITTFKLENAKGSETMKFYAKESGESGIEVIKAEKLDIPVNGSDVGDPILRTIIKPGYVDVTAGATDAGKGDVNGVTTGIIKAETLLLGDVPFTANSFAVKGGSEQFTTLTTGNLVVKEDDKAQPEPWLGNATVGGTLGVTGKTTLGDLDTTGSVNLTGTVNLNGIENSFIDAAENKTTLAVNFTNNATSKRIGLHKKVTDKDETVLSDKAIINIEEKEKEKEHREASLSFQSRSDGTSQWKIGHFQNLHQDNNSLVDLPSFDVEYTSVVGTSDPDTIAKYLPEEVQFKKPVTVSGQLTVTDPAESTNLSVATNCLSLDNVKDRNGTKWEIGVTQLTAKEQVKREIVDLAKNVSELAESIYKRIEADTLTGIAVNDVTEKLNYWAKVVLAVAGSFSESTTQKYSDIIKMDPTTNVDNPYDDGDPADNNISGALYDALFATEVGTLVDTSYPSDMGDVTLHSALFEIKNAALICNGIAGAIKTTVIPGNAESQYAKDEIFWTFAESAGDYYENTIASDLLIRLNNMSSETLQATQLVKNNNLMVKVGNDATPIASFSKGNATSEDIVKGVVPQLGNFHIGEVNARSYSFENATESQVSDNSLFVRDGQLVFRDASGKMYPITLGPVIEE